LSEPTDKEVMLLVKEGDLDMMKLLFNRHYRPMYNFLYHMTHDKQASEDMVQNVFFRMLKYRNTYTAKGEFVTWMFHLGRNVLKDQFKKQKRTGNYYELEEVSDTISAGILADEQLGKKEAQHQLYRAMEKLNEEEREILVLNKFQELKYHEIAHVLNINEGAVKVRIHRAFIHLKSIYLKMESYEL
jgi:RNA polymerase sigma factor (sigma-70 family)